MKQKKAALVFQEVAHLQSKFSRVSAKIFGFFFGAGMS